MACPGCGVDTPMLRSARMEGNKVTDHHGPSWCKPCIDAKVTAARGGVVGPTPAPQPKKKLPPVHMIKDIKREEKGEKAKATLTTLCGVVGRARGMYGTTKEEVSGTIWRLDVTCPLCKRMPSMVAPVLGPAESLPDPDASSTLFT